jgi:hypothetical protein
MELMVQFFEVKVGLYRTLPPIFTDLELTKLVIGGVVYSLKTKVCRTKGA